MLSDSTTNVYAERDVTITRIPGSEDGTVTICLYATHHNHGRGAVERIQREILDAHGWICAGEKDVDEAEYPPKYVPPRPKKADGAMVITRPRTPSAGEKARDKARRMCYPRYSARG